MQEPKRQAVRQAVRQLCSEAVSGSSCTTGDKMLHVCGCHRQLLPLLGSSLLPAAIDVACCCLQYMQKGAKKIRGSDLSSFAFDVVGRVSKRC